MSDANSPDRLAISATEPKPSRALNPLCVDAKTLGQLLGGYSARKIYDMDASGQLGPQGVKLSDRGLRFDYREVSDWWRACKEAGRCIGRVEWQRRAMQ